VRELTRSDMSSEVIGIRARLENIVQRGLPCFACAAAAKRALGNAMGRPSALRRRKHGHRHGLSERCKRRLKLLEPRGMVEPE
jgi:hypothetical protein